MLFSLLFCFKDALASSLVLIKQPQKQQSLDLCSPALYVLIAREFIVELFPLSHARCR